MQIELNWNHVLYNNFQYQVPELDYLLILCCEENATIAATSRRCMLSLIKHNLVDLEGCMKHLMFHVSAAKYVFTLCLIWY